MIIRCVGLYYMEIIFCIPVFDKSELKVATISLLGAWAVYGMDDRVLFYIEDNMVNAKKFMGKMPNVFPLLVGTGKRRIW